MLTRPPRGLKRSRWFGPATVPNPASEKASAMSDPNPNITGGPAPEPKPATPAAPAAAAPRVAPAPKPAAKPAAKPGGKGGDRRSFLIAMFTSWFVAAWTAMVATLTLMTLGTLRFLFPNVLAEPPS